MKYKHVVTKRSNLHINKTKLMALRDISKECGKGKFFTKNYIIIENQIRRSLELSFGKTVNISDIKAIY